MTRSETESIETNTEREQALTSKVPRRMLSRGLEQIQDLLRYRLQLLGARPLDDLERVDPVDEHGETAMEVAAPVVALEQLLVEVMAPLAVADPEGA